ncbi:unnamed protein product [Polarella glacialis]|uniref:Fungal lipase-type domain-containing protein n=1 Tax=Polarella glacialis TaxID=89957 RepID=A0A813JF30_POLGL|nr:unnamed protein product [Polarella glacialis]CAE8675535.1 unnamed protein product [Polarella glacialis]
MLRALGCDGAFVDATVVLSFELVPFCGVLYGLLPLPLRDPGRSDSLLEWYFRGAFCWAMCLPIVMAVCRLASHNPGVLERYHICSEGLTELKLRCLSSTVHLSASTALTSLEDATGSQLLGSEGTINHEGLEHPDVCVRWDLVYVEDQQLMKASLPQEVCALVKVASAAQMVFLTISAVNYCTDPFLHQTTSRFLALLFVAGLLFVLQVVVNRTVPGTLGWTYTALAASVGILVAAALVIDLIQMDNYNGGSDHLIFKPSGQGSHYHPIPLNGQYPVCLTRWSNSLSPNQQPETMLSALDLGVFAAASYSRGPNVMDIVSNATAGTPFADFSIEESADDAISGSWIVFGSNATKMRVIAVRGTQVGVDLVGDVSLFATIALLQFANHVFPLLTIMSVNTVRRVIATFELERWTGEPRLWDPLVNTTRAWKDASEATGYQLVLTGHSLGGVLAAIVAARLQVPAMTFSPPGEFYSLDRFGALDDKVQHTLVSVQPAHDLVPTVDVQAGFNQHIGCHASALDCHSIQRTLCELYHGCGDPRGRVWASAFRPEEQCNYA